MVDDLTVSAIEKENFSIQEETSLIRSKTHQLEKLIYQLECSLKLKSATINGLSKSASVEESKFNCLKLDVDENSTSSNDFAVSTSQPNDDQSIGRDPKSLKIEKKSFKTFEEKEYFWELILENFFAHSLDSWVLDKTLINPQILQILLEPRENF